MKEARRERSPVYPKIVFGFTAHPITVWAGVILLRLYFEWIKLREELSKALVGFAKHSNNQISSVEVMLSWCYGLALGAEPLTILYGMTFKNVGASGTCTTLAGL